MRDNRHRTSHRTIEYIEEALNEWGGPKAFAKELKRRYDAPTTNAHAKVRILDMMMQFLKMQHDLLPKDGVLSEMTDDELDRELQAILTGEPDEDEGEDG